MEVDVHHQLVSRSAKRFVRALLALLLALFPAGRASAFELQVSSSGPSIVGASHTFTAIPTGATGAVTYEWRFGESAAAEAGGAEAAHVFAAPGLYGISVEAVDSAGDSGTAFFQHLAHFPLTPQRPTASSPLIYDSKRNRVYSLNQDNDTVTVIDPETLMRVGEIEVYRRPESLALTPLGKLWVVHQDDYAVAVVDPERLAVESGFRLPYASQPVALAMSPTGDAAYVSLMATGKLLKLDPASGATLAEVAVGPKPRGIAVSFDGKDVYVSRFVSPDTGGEVVKVSAATMSVATRIVLKLDTQTEDSDQRSRGLPNYLFSVALAPDGRQAWVPGKKDNIVRGLLRDGQDLTHDTTVRPLAAVIDVLTASEIFENRVDLDDRSMPVHAEFSPYGNFVILALAGSNRIEIRDVNNPTKVFSAIGDVGAFPRASVLAPNQRLFVQGALSRSVLVYDMTELLQNFSSSTPKKLAQIQAVTSDKVSPQILEGKRIFHNAAEPRMSNEGYLSCGGCHFEGMDDGRVYDFSGRGEGLRNTISLLGHAGTKQGPLNWAATLDEVQDFEHQIRGLFGGTGFLPDELFHVGTRDQPRGDAKAGLSPELDALSAYVSSLARTSPSPFRNADGTLTSDGLAGKGIFKKLGCDFCHSGAEFTDSARGFVHDVGTLGALSGHRAGAPLLGLDTPSLLGVWETPPYLHDGSAATLRDVLTGRNPKDEHGFVSSLSATQVDQLVSYLQQIDEELPARRLPFEPPATTGGAVNGSGGSALGGSGNSAGGVATGGGGAASVAGASGMAPTQPPGPTAAAQSGLPGCACTAASRTAPDASALVGEAWLLLSLWVIRRRKQAGARAALMLALASLALACAPSASGTSDSSGGQNSQGDGGTGQGGQVGVDDWSLLPPVTNPERELQPLGSRQATIDRLCSRKRGDSFAEAFCGSAPRATIRDLKELLQLVGLGDQRAFALTGNSTSLVAKSVSPINPRLIAFPRVESDGQRPQSLTALGFVRGEQFVELVSRDPVTKDYNFYLISFEQRCNYDQAGCMLADLLTESVERDWTAYSVYDQDDLEPTSFDCLSCHRLGGPGTPRMLRMQELTSPWMHWFPQRFVQRTDSDRTLLAEFAETHEFDQHYGGIPMASITGALDDGSAAQLEALVRAEGFGDQPNPFDAQIAMEMKTGSSPTWLARFTAHLSGAAIAVPYPGLDVTDAAKRTAATRSYRDVVQGQAPRTSLLDIRDVFSTDATEKLSFVSKPGADGKTVLLQMCARCHQGRSAPSAAKSRFNVLELGTMSRAEKDLAIARINDTKWPMPPARAGALSPEGRQAAIAELQR